MFEDIADLGEGLAADHRPVAGGAGVAGAEGVHQAAGEFGGRRMPWLAPMPADRSAASGCRTPGEQQTAQSGHHRNQIDTAYDMLPSTFPTMLRQNDKIITHTGRNSPYGYVRTGGRFRSTSTNQQPPFGDNRDDALGNQLLLSTASRWSTGRSSEGLARPSRLPMPDYPPLQPYCSRSVKDLLAKYDTAGIQPGQAVRNCCSARAGSATPTGSGPILLAARQQVDAADHQRAWTARFRRVDRAGARRRCCGATARVDANLGAAARFQRPVPSRASTVDRSTYGHGGSIRPNREHDTLRAVLQGKSISRKCSARIW